MKSALRNPHRSVSPCPTCATGKRKAEFLSNAQHRGTSLHQRIYDISSTCELARSEGEGGNVNVVNQPNEVSFTSRRAAVID
eukprot:scaffold186677_cov18-Tisochrysis_lutea.AAC.1